MAMSFKVARAAAPLQVAPLHIFSRAIFFFLSPLENRSELERGADEADVTGVVLF